MVKLNNVMTNKLFLQLEEAREQGLKKLAGAVNYALISENNEEDSFNYEELQEIVYQNMWKSAVEVIKYHQLQSADIVKIDQILERYANKIIQDVEQSLNVPEDQVGPLESKVPGEK